MGEMYRQAKTLFQEHLCKIVFTKAYPTCHNVNKSTCTGDNMDIIIGFSTGDLIWLDPISSKYSRLNKGVSSKGKK